MSSISPRYVCDLCTLDQTQQKVPGGAELFCTLASAYQIILPFIS